MTAPGQTLLLLSGLFKLGATLLILLMLAKLGWDFAIDSEVEVPTVLIAAIGGTLAAQWAAWYGWRRISRRDAQGRGA